MGWRTGCGLLGASLVLLGLLLPQGWYDAIPTAEGFPLPPIRGVTLLRISFVLEGLLLVWVSLAHWRFRRIREGERLPRSDPPGADGPGGLATVRWLLPALTALALFLRLLKVNSDLWLDEILLVMVYSKAPVSQVIGSYLSSNNHLLYTLLMKLSVGWFGEQEWAIRLAAVLFGTATVPVMYWVARLLKLSRWASLSASLLLALSYHHIFFSQNARGYSGYLFFSLLSSALLLRALQEDRLRFWVPYVLTMLLNLALLLNSGFVLMSHALVGLAVVFCVHRAGSSPRPLLRRLVGVFGLIGLLGFQLYATALPAVYVFVTTAYAGPGGGYAPFSAEFLAELVRGISAGFGTGVLLGAVPFLLLAAWGGYRLMRNQWVLATSLSLPLLLTALYLLAQGLKFTPRFFILAVPVAILAATQAIFGVAHRAALLLGKGDTVLPLGLAATAVLTASAISVASLPRYYRVPKQPYRASIEYLRALRSPGDAVIVIDLAEMGYRFYGGRSGLNEEFDWFFVRSVPALDAVLESHSQGRRFLVTTLQRLLRLRYPDLFERIRRDWTPAQSFPATIGDGEITVWEESRPAK